MPSTQHDIAVAWMNSFDDLDLEANLALRTPNCEHNMAPASGGGQGSMTHEQWKAHGLFLKSMILKFPVKAKEFFEHEGSNQITVWATSEVEFRKEAMDDDPSVDWSYHGEYMFIFVFNKTGDKLERIIEFLDSARVQEVYKLVARAQNNLTAKKEDSQ